MDLLAYFKEVSEDSNFLISVFAGLVVLALASVGGAIFKFCILTFKFFKKDPRISGDYALLHLNYNENLQKEVIPHFAKIRRNFFVPGYKFDVGMSANFTVPIAKGRAYLEEDQLIATAKSSRSSTTISYRFLTSDRTKRAFWPGFGMTRDYPGKPSVNTCVLTPYQVDDKEYKMMLTKHYSLDAQNRILSIK